VTALRGTDEKRAEHARSLRRALTPAELTLWTRIRARRLGGFKFVRQKPIDRYYVDFVSREPRLIIELDGGQHAESRKDRPSPRQRGEGDNCDRPRTRSSMRTAVSGAISSQKCGLGLVAQARRKRSFFDRWASIGVQP